MSGTLDPRVRLRPVKLSSLDLRGKRLGVIGGTNGLGRAIARVAAGRGAQVVVVGRTFRDHGISNLSFVRADLSSMKEAERLGRDLGVERLDALVLTTGTMAARRRELTSEGLERDMAVSYLSRLVVIRGAAPRLGSARGPQARPPRVFVMGFPGTGQLGELGDLTGERSYDAMKVHLNTVAGNEALVLESRERFPSVHFFGLNPGLIKTGIRTNFLGTGLKHQVIEFFVGLLRPSPTGYAERIVPVLFAQELDHETGVMFDWKGKPILPSEGLAGQRAARLINESEKLVSRVVALPA